MDPQLIRFIIQVNAVLFSIILWIWALVDLSKHQKPGTFHKVSWVMWMLFITFVPITGPIIYLVRTAFRRHNVA